jgi:hypothetical protein
MKTAHSHSTAPYVAGSEPSRKAAIDIQDIRTDLQRRVYKYIKDKGEKGATDEETQFALAMNPSTQRPRRVELVDMGLVKDSGTTRKTASGRSATVWVVA